MKKIFFTILAVFFFAATNSFAQSWKLTGNSGAVISTDFFGTTDKNPLAIRTNNAERMRFTTSGFIGIGTKTPSGNLNVFGKTPLSLSSPGSIVIGDIAGPNIGIDAQVIQSRYNGTFQELSINSFGGTTTFGNSANSYYGVYSYGNNYGVYGIATSGYGVEGYDQNSSGNSFNCGVYGYESSSGNALYGVAIGTGGFGLYASSLKSDGVYATTANSSAYAGYFDGTVYTTGTYTSSDESLKQNIVNMQSAMNIINQLHPKQYEFRQDGNYKLMNLPQGQHYGLIAQDVEQILPALVKDSKFNVAKAQLPTPQKPGDPKATASSNTVAANSNEMINFKALNYTELIPIIIKGMQEQQETIQTQQQQIVQQQAQIDELKNLISAVTKNASTNITLTDASLGQNFPNPFKGITAINYTLPEKFNSAQLLIKDNSGNTLKIITVAGAGKGSVNVDASTIAAGAYSYSLLIDGKIIDTKQMILNK